MMTFKMINQGQVVVVGDYHILDVGIGSYRKEADIIDLILHLE